jgi:16S rRNA (adenine1518-N6/adenine1519-N6)-dimethyltransferase
LKTGTATKRYLMISSPAESIERLPPLREVIAEYGLNAKRALGQHFLLDLNLTRRIASSANSLNVGTTVEIGPGPGGLTRALLMEGAGRIVAIECDERCVKALGPLVDAAEGRLEIIHGDALGVDLSELGPPPVRVVANLPYNIATPLLIRWLALGADVSEMVLMFQLEVAERITAVTGRKPYGRLGVMSNWCAETKFLFRIPARAFTPPPRVDSAVVRLVPYKQPAFPGERLDIETVTAAAFGQRRKTLRRSLGRLGVSVPELLEQTGIDGGRRAEELNIEEFSALAVVFSGLRGDL